MEPPLTRIDRNVTQLRLELRLSSSILLALFLAVLWGVGKERSFQEGSIIMVETSQRPSIKDRVPQRVS